MTADATRDLRRARPTGSRSARPARCRAPPGAARGRQRRRVRGHLPRRARRPAPGAARRPCGDAARHDLLRHYDLDVVQRVGGDARGAAHRQPRTSCTPTSRCCSARRVRPARPSWSGSRATTCVANARSDRRVPRPAADRPGDHRAADALLLRPLRAQQPPAAGPAWCSPTCRWPTRASGTWLRAHGVTAMAGVPYTYELLDAVRLRRPSSCPSLRYAHPGRRPDGARAGREYAELGRSAGWELFVMYGQTEATARMAYLPPDLAASPPRRRRRPDPRRGPADSCRSPEATGPASASSSTPGPT